MESLDEVVGPRARSFCVRVGPAAASAAVLRGAAAVLALRGPWVVVVDATPSLVGAVRHDLLGLDAVERRFVPVVSAGAAPPGPWVVASPSIVDALLDGLV